MKFLLRAILGLVAIAVAAAAALVLMMRGGRLEDAGTISPSRVAPGVIAGRAQAQATAAKMLSAGTSAAAPGPAKQILFGDLHVHTTFSADAFQRSIPLLQGEGAHPPADACDFARFCSGLDFWSINDHAEGVSPLHWKETKESIRACNAAAGDPRNPDIVAFLGWEWTQAGDTAANHYGHKNVIFRDTAEDKVPARPISAGGRTLALLRGSQPLWQRMQVLLLDLPNRQRYLDLGEFQREISSTPMCPSGVDVHDLPTDCMESAETPHVLFEKLSQWGGESLVIPHGTTWGFYTPPGVTLDKQLTAAENDPSRQTLVEIYSGHGNSEEYRSWKEIDHDAQGNAVCPAPTKDYLPCCWRAGELIRERCGDAPAAECDRRVREAQQNYLAAGAAGHTTVVGATPEEWQDCGQCRDCYNPAFSMRPGDSVQYGLAIGNFDDPGPPKRFRWGIIGSSDNHSARPGTGFKEFDRRRMTEVTGARDSTWHDRLNGAPPPRKPESEPFDPLRTKLQLFQLTEFERQASFFMTGGIVAVHAEGRDRDSIWNAFKRREVYATSGDRMLLWFDLLNGPGGAQPMGTEATLGHAPRFRVRAAGAFRQKPGCPEDSRTALAPERLERLCRGECYNPGDERKRITRIEVVRIRPQVRKGEPVAPLIEDPWRRIDCPDNPSGCVVEFEDPDFMAGGREATYYVRAIEEPSDAVNAGNLRCTYDENGRCTKLNPCWGDFRLPYEEDCLAKNEERAWSSPIFLVPGAPDAPAAPTAPAAAAQG